MAKKVQNEININGFKHVKYDALEFSTNEMLKRAESFYHFMDKRRSVRGFSNKEVPRSVIENILKTASTAPSGAHKQPWTFCVVSNKELKRKIRVAAEAEEKETYENRMGERWKNDLAAMATDMHKPFLEIAPWIIVAFKRAYEYKSDGTKHNNYYVNESVGLACGMLITAIHNAGLATLTHTPSPMKFLTELLNRPDNERAFLLLPVGYPEDPVYVPDLKRKSLEDISEFYE
ncbi:nitroreductase family protein [Lutimonas saemankumensis]|uniref:nitroreductase family protein n=1 Tax=Lutimonas saemankumensis TaxID=483016 RepID=UPI001CD5C3C4|nr:nitroreductase family protein [Lutimonas saemankumensis]MCA0933816.1 nitroreductase family protein [Lutimonas saemankumensis]